MWLKRWYSDIPPPRKSLPCRAKGKPHPLDIVPLVKEPYCRSTQVWHAFQRIAQFYLHTHVFIHEWNESYLPLLPSWSWSSFIDCGGIEGWVGLGTTIVSKQSAQDCYVIAMTVVIYSSCHASLGNWRTGTSNSWPLVPQTTKLTTEPPSHPYMSAFPRTNILNPTSNVMLNQTIKD